MLSCSCILAVLMAVVVQNQAFHFHKQMQKVSACRVPSFQSSILFASDSGLVAASDTIDEQVVEVQPKACYYKRVDGMWRQRKQLNKLFIGERLFATRLPECDLIDGVTGPKVFLECGVGRTIDKGQKWKIVNGMMRIGKKTGKKNRVKESVIRKKIAKLPSDSLVEVYVSKIKLEHASFEVCLKKEDAIEEGKRPRPISAATLTVGQKLFGYVKDITPYGVFIDVGANRKGLLHITKVAKHYDQFVNKEEGLKSIGLKQGAPIHVVVAKNEKKRLEFDFPPVEVYADKKVEQSASPDSTTNETLVDYSSISEEEAAAWASYGNNNDPYDISEEEAAMWAAYGSGNNEEEEEDDRDEDRDIEDALGIGSW